MLSLFLALAAAAAAPAPIEVTGSDFRAEQADGEGQTLSVSTTRIPLEVGICYRWTLNVRPGPGVRVIEERLELPSAPEGWGGVDENDTSPTKLTERGRIATTTMIVALKDGLIGNGWCVAEGDPEGAYKIIVSSGGKLLHRFDFTLAEAENAEAEDIEEDAPPTRY